MKAILALEDGTYFEGRSFGAHGEQSGEMVFNTSMTGYQEVVTDPSYAGQIIAMTYPHIGNYGVNDQDNESNQPFLRGFVVRELSRRYSNWRANGSFEEFLSRHSVMGIEGVDTRTLTKHLRSRGAMRAVISTLELDPQKVIVKAQLAPGLVGRDLVSQVTCEAPYSFGSPRDGHSSSRKIVAFDFGIKGNIIRCLESLGCYGEVVSANTTAEQVLAMNPDGVFLSNGPGDPAAVTYAIKTISDLLGKVPVFGICLGHQLLGHALGGSTFKLKFGHRGGNQPVKDLSTGKIEITSQNHGFAVDAAQIPTEGRFGKVEVTHINLNDNTVEGLRCLDVPAFSVQYHPEAAPGPHDSFYLFRRFMELIDNHKGVTTLTGERVTS